jgi:hypothetical protein
LSGNPISIECNENNGGFRDPFLGWWSAMPPDGFRQAAQLVLFHDATYIVICPGPATELMSLAQQAGDVWRDTPFIPDSEDLAITMRLTMEENMRLTRGQAIPAILEYDGVNHIIDYGRG